MLLAQTKLFSALQTPVALYLFLQSSVSAQIYDLRDVSNAVPTRPLSPGPGAPVVVCLCRPVLPGLV